MAPAGEFTEAAASFARAVVSVGPLLEALGSRPPLPVRTPRRALEPAVALTRRLKVTGLAFVPEDGTAPAPAAGAAADTEVFVQIVADRLRPALAALASAASGPEEGARAVEAAATAARDTGVARWRAETDALAADGALLRTYAAGDRSAPTVVLVSACGMPAEICEPWMRFLSRDHHVVTWESRGLFGASGGPDDFDRLGHSVRDQAADLVTVMDYHGVESAHVMGLCGGAVLALRAAADHPGRVGSLSLWHGDYELGREAPKTDHQLNLQALMGMAAEDRLSAASINSALCQSAPATTPPGLAHLVLLPYADAELFYRYCVLNGAIMTADVFALLDAVKQPTLVVTSEDDHTAHPEGSRVVAARLSDARLRVEPHGDHLSLFGAGARLEGLAADFLARHTVRS
ncbi:alpha/beta fold hydrolase [Streptomyces sp. NPDC058374]|uniref:alpha/beta fold hydrolase n=1 Tax=unclassified Streptomyces TaxID=2593676 RepID=UPI0036574BA8